MDIVYTTKKIEKLLTNQQIMKRTFGTNDAKYLISILQQIRYANSLADIPESPRPRRHKLKGIYKNYWGIHFTKKDVLVVNPIGDYDVDDISTIKSIEIVKVEDYH
ncbi:MAG: plasmid maintenance system killer protein [Spirochaetia bacterium]|nr:plasmid maintenance system killer protein [Spirochaetia bacterium]